MTYMMYLPREIFITNFDYYRGSVQGGGGKGGKSGGKILFTKMQAGLYFYLMVVIQGSTSGTHDTGGNFSIAPDWGQNLH